MKQKDLASESSDVQLVEQKRPLLSSQSTDLSSNVEDEVTVDIKKIIQDRKDGPPSSTCCIYRVPLTIRHLKGNAYTPKFVSIGPFHHDNKDLQDMEMYKPIVFEGLTQRFGQNFTSSLNNLVHLVKDLEPKVRASYSETISLSKQQLVKLTLMDAGFIIELFLMYHEQSNKDAKLTQPWLWNAIVEDLILLENQLPFFIIEELFNKAFPKEHHKSLPSFLELMYKYFEYYNKQGLKPRSDVKIEHFTDLLRLFYLDERDQSERTCSKTLDKGDQSEQVAFSGTENHILLYNVNALHEAGIQLTASGSECLLNLNFSGHSLEIPPIWVEDGTEILFRNMIALEQCYYPLDGYIRWYVIVMDWLIDTSKDVELLVHNKIVSNHLGEPKNVAELFNGLAKNVCQMNFNPEYAKICNKLNRYCEDCWPQMKATLRRDYCGTPWQTVASIAGIVLLFLTVVQTVFSILQVV